MITTNPDGRHSLIEPPALKAYSLEEINRAKNSWPSIARYLALIERTPGNDGDLLRIERHRHWLRCALATLLNRAPAESVCRFWSKMTDQIVLKAWQLSGCDQADLCLFALGKLGAEELNLSSDIDLVVIRRDGVRGDIRTFRKFQQLLAEHTEFGFCYRVDLSLRPGGKGSAVLPSQSELEYHYGYQGEMWERMALVRLRALAGPHDLSAAIVEFARKFSYRRHLDYSLFDDLQSLRSRIRSEQPHDPDRPHLKLMPGGIRDLELFVHSLQIIHGGRSPALQTFSTTQALKKIRDLGVLPTQDVQILLNSYWHLRTIENHIQGYDDQQTYIVSFKETAPAFSEISRDDLKNLTHPVNQIVTSLLGESENQKGFPSTLDGQKKWLLALGYSSFSCDQTFPELMAATVLSRRSSRDEKARRDFLFGFVSKLAEIGLDKDLGLSLLLDFVRSTRAKASFFSLLNHEPRVRDELAMLFSISPYLGSLLTSRPELIDEYIFRRQAQVSSELGPFLEEIAERRLLCELIAANKYLIDRNLPKLTQNLSETADAICQTLLDRLALDYGPAQLGLMPMGKWSGFELGLRSDLDFIFLCPNEPQPNEQKMAKRFLSRITEAHRGGSIYSVDMRLRPSGHAGPLLVSQKSLRKYLSEEAAAWERQAYLRSRPLIDLPFRPSEIASQSGLSDQDFADLHRIRQQLFTRPTANELDLKLARGGLAYVEFAAQIALLARKEFSLDPSTTGMIQYLESVDSRWNEVGPDVRNSYQFLREIEQLFQLTTSQSGSKVRVKSDEFKRLALIMNEPAEDLNERIRSVFSTHIEKLSLVDIIES